MVGLIRLIVLFGILYFFYRLFKAFFLTAETKTNNRPLTESKAKGEDLVEDPYCHRYLPMSQAFRMSVGGNDVFFCSQECYDQYRKIRDLNG